MRDRLIRIEGRDPVHVSDCSYCRRCGDTLFPGDDYYELGGEVLCEDCMDLVLRGMRRTVGE